ncbi:hypothetical protein DERP_009761 [Dermatophagoides pteronyssinus]|uniref:Uncharacterized protein n=1 Tax=Dermatophagoides pteronyssinus TaxID=6956 RepID=A0ABQ8IR44_DERPT|nr:hypothetical protein DERP_009761 [Dermatophagoides pteronyssinus]
MKITENIFDDKNFEFKIPETLPANVDDFIDEGSSLSSTTSTLNIEQSQLSSNDQSSGYYLRKKIKSKLHFYRFLFIRLSLGKIIDKL